jgi:hypothetical protein
VTCTKQRLSFHHTLDKQHNFLHSLWVCFRNMQLYHNANATDVYSSSNHCDGTKGQPRRKAESNCQGKNAGISYTSTPVVRSGPYKGIHLGTHLWTHTDIKCLRCQQ